MSDKEQVILTFQLVYALAATVHETGEHGCPAGVLYAALQGKLSIDQFKELVRVMKEAKLIRESNHIFYSLVTAEAKA